MGVKIERGQKKEIIWIAKYGGQLPRRVPQIWNEVKLVFWSCHLGSVQRPRMSPLWAKANTTVAANKARLGQHRICWFYKLVFFKESNYPYFIDVETEISQVPVSSKLGPLSFCLLSRPCYGNCTMNISPQRRIKQHSPGTMSTALGWWGKAALLAEAPFTAGLTFCPKTALITMKFPQTQDEWGRRWLHF